MTRLSTQQIERLFLEGAVDGLNRAANLVASMAIEEAPLGPARSAPKGEGGEGHEGGTGMAGELRGSALYPLNDPDHEATVEDPEALVSFNTVYAAAQHEGRATMTNHTTGRTYEWVVRRYTTPGTKKKYLEDPLKAVVGGGQLERIIAESTRQRLTRAEATARFGQVRGL